jgi:proteasome lid subunit RPN8/RPN11
VAEPGSIRLAEDALGAIREAARGAYPHEGCGALVGPAGGPIALSLALPNREADQPRVRFSVSPRDYMEVEDAAESKGLALLGFWHSHPDHPARPSETDRRYAWEGLLTLVIAVEQGEPRDLTAWAVDGPDAPFRELRLEIVPNGRVEDARQEKEER